MKGSLTASAQQTFNTKGFMERLWKPVPGYEGYYEISNDGLLRSVARISMNSLGYYRQLQGCLMAPSVNKSGYVKYSLAKDGKSKTITAHQLVAMAFLGHNREFNHLTVNHIDGDKTNNQIDNLEIVSMTENRRHAIRNGLWNQRGVNAIKAKLTAEDLIEIRRLWALGKYRQIDLARMFNVGKSTIGRAVRHERCD